MHIRSLTHSLTLMGVDMFASKLVLVSKLLLPPK